MEDEIMHCLTVGYYKHILCIHLDMHSRQLKGENIYTMALLCRCWSFGGCRFFWVRIRYSAILFVVDFLEAADVFFVFYSALFALAEVGAYFAVCQSVRLWKPEPPKITIRLSRSTLRHHIRTSFSLCFQFLIHNFELNRYRCSTFMRVDISFWLLFRID